MNGLLSEKYKCWDIVGSTSKNRLQNRGRLQNSLYFCVFKYARAVKQKVWNEAENRERDWGETLKIRACEARELRARKTLTPRFTDFFTDFEKKPTVLQSRTEEFKLIVAPWVIRARWREI